MDANFLSLLNCFVFGIKIAKIRKKNMIFFLFKFKCNPFKLVFVLVCMSAHFWL